MNRKTFLATLAGALARPWRVFGAPKAAIPELATKEKIGPITYQTFKIDHLEEGEWTSLERDLRGKWRWVELKEPIRYRLSEDGKVFEKVDS